MKPDCRVAPLRRIRGTVFICAVGKTLQFYFFFVISFVKYGTYADVS